MRGISQMLISHGFLSNMYANEIVIFFHDKYLDIAIFPVNSALSILSDPLLQPYFATAPKKCRWMVLNRKRYLGVPAVSLDNQPIQFSSSIRYFNLLLSSKLSWFPSF